MTVAYLKDILNQAKLYVRPLQKHISEDDMKPYSFPNVSNRMVWNNYRAHHTDSYHTVYFIVNNASDKHISSFRMLLLNQVNFAKPVNVCFHYLS